MQLATFVAHVEIKFSIGSEDECVHAVIVIGALDIGEKHLGRAVCFVKEIVPRWAIAAVARGLYGEPYECWSMDHERTERTVAYRWSKGGRNNSLSVEIDESIGVPPEGSHGEFIIEHYWGYTGRGNGRVDEYRVEHPKWELFSVKNERIDVDFGAVYGSEFAFLADERPFSVLLAKGSEVAVYKGKQI